MDFCMAPLPGFVPHAQPAWQADESPVVPVMLPPVVGGQDRLGEDPAIPWATASEELVDWVQRNLVNRTDAFGAYLPLGRREPGRSNNYTAPAKAVDRFDGVLTADIIRRHFRGEDTRSGRWRSLPDHPNSLL